MIEAERTPELDYYIAVAHYSVDNVQPTLTNDEKADQRQKRQLLLPDREYIDFYTYVTTPPATKLKLISRDYFPTEGRITDELALKRCLALSLPEPERFVPIAKGEIVTDRDKALNWITVCLHHLIIRQAKYHGITYGSNPRKDIVTCSNLGVSLTECEAPCDFEAVWDCIYGVFDAIPNWRNHLEDALLAQFSWKFHDTTDTGGMVSCIHKLASFGLNVIRRLVNGFAQRKGKPTVGIKRPADVITAENRWQKRVKKEGFKSYFVISDKVSIDRYMIVLY
jgi:hypothetical protein